MSRHQIQSTLPFMLVIALIVLIDQISKSWVIGYLGQQESIHDSGLITLRIVYNTGMGFGLFQGSGPLVGWLSIGIIAGLMIWLTRIDRSKWLLRVGLALLIGGALGNMVDRVLAGRVLDFIESPLWPSVFNLADVAIRAGALLSIIGAMTRSVVQTENHGGWTPARG